MASWRLLRPDLSLRDALPPAARRKVEMGSVARGRRWRRLHLPFSFALIAASAPAVATPVPQLVAEVDTTGTSDPTDVVFVPEKNQLYLATKDNPGGLPGRPEFYIFDMSVPA